MRRGFTIIELLVASLLLGMLVTIMTMIFNQSSIAWRTALAGTADLGLVCENISAVREEADNAFVYDKKLYRLTGLWDRTGDPRSFRNRACDAPGSTDESDSKAFLLGGESRTGNGQWIDNLSNLKTDGFKNGLLFSNSDSGSGNGTAHKGGQGGSQGSHQSKDNYTVNVKSAGPNRKFGDWDDIWSWPDEFE